MALRKSFIFCLAFTIICVGASAQISLTGSLSGTVTDSAGEHLPGVSVTLSSPALMVPSLSGVTTGHGFYRFAALPPGTYTVTFQLDGFAKLVREEIRINAGTAAALDARLELKEIGEEVVVVGKAPTIDKVKSSGLHTMPTEFLESIPSARDLSSFFNMLPGVVDDTSHGGSQRDNTYNLEGVNISDPVLGTQNVGFSMEIMDELSTQTGGLQAEYGSVRGAVINVVTKSGGNKFSGAVNAYYRSKGLQADNTAGTPFEGQSSGFDYEADGGFSLGGPIIKDRLWFFGNLTYYSSDSYILGYPWDAQPDNTAIDLRKPFAYGKLSLQINPRQKLVLSYNYSNSRSDHDGASYQRNEDATAVLSVPTHTLNIQWTSFFSHNFFTEAKFAFVDFTQNTLSKNEQDRLYETSTRKYSQSYGYDEAHAKKRYQAILNATDFVDRLAGGHEFKAGVEFEYSWDRRDRSYNRDERIGLGPDIYLTNGVPSYVIHQESYIRRDRKLVLGGFVQDAWALGKRLNLNLGVRFDHQEGIIPRQGQEREPVVLNGVTYYPAVEESFKPIIWNTLAPRFGVSYDLTGDGKTVVKANLGRYYIANVMQWFVTVNPNSTLSWRQRLNSDWTLRGTPYNVSSAAASTMDPNLRSPYVDEMTIGIEREILSDFRLGIRYIKKWDRNLIEDVNPYALDYEALIRGELIWTNFQPVTVVDPYDGSTVTFYEQIDLNTPSGEIVTNPPGAERNYDGLEISLLKRFSHGWQMNASYVWAHSRGLIGTSTVDDWSGRSYYNNPNYHINRVGRFPEERRHQFKLQAAWQGPWGINLGGYFRYMSGARYARSITSSHLGLDLAQGSVTILAEERGSRACPDQAILDLRLDKSFEIGRLGRLEFMIDVFNLFNANTITAVQEVSSSSSLVFEEATSICSPRIIRLGFRFQF